VGGLAGDAPNFPGERPRRAIHVDRPASFSAKDGGVGAAQVQFPGMLGLRRDWLPRILLAVFSPSALYACTREENCSAGSTLHARYADKVM
jgi:hypothetical protein